MSKEIIEYEDMSDEAQRIVDAGQTYGGTIPQGLTFEELVAWLKATFLGQ